MLRAHLLPAKGRGVIEPSELDAWRAPRRERDDARPEDAGEARAHGAASGAARNPMALAARLRPFIRRRVTSEADADDVLQDVFLRLMRGLPGLRDEERFGPWVYQLARNAIIDHQRAAARLLVVDLQPGREAAEPSGERPPRTAGQARAAGADTGLGIGLATGMATGAALGLARQEDRASDDDRDDDAMERELARYVAPFVAMLPSPYREALTLTELEGLTQKQAAELLGLSLSGMKSRVQRGRRALRQALEACCHIELDARGKVMDFAPRPDGRLPASCCNQPAANHAARGCGPQPGAASADGQTKGSTE